MLSNDHIKRFNQLIEKYLRKETTAEESSFVEKYYESYEHKTDLTDTLSESEKDIIQHRMLAHLRAGIQPAGSPRVAGMWRQRIIRFSAAAAIAAVIAGIYFWSATSQPVQQKGPVSTLVAVVPDAIPGENRATLTLSDGSTIILDSSGAGTITQQGTTRVVKLSNGEIVYQPDKNGVSSIFINTMTTPRGGQYQLTLPDGTKVWLNAASSISYPTAFVEKERRVKMTGEAYFEVAKNAERPFFVTLNDQTEVKVLGTHFNVNAYADEGSTHTTLLEGAVVVKKASQTQLLKPGQQAEVNNAIKVKNNIDLDVVMAWKSGYFSFNSTNLETVMKQLSRWYDVDVVYEGKMPDMKFWGGISRRSNLSQVIKILEESKVNFRIESKKITVLSK